MFTKVKINEFQTYWPITQTQADCHNAFSPFGYRTYYIRILPRYGALSQGYFYNFLHYLNADGMISFRDVCHCGDCWVYIFDSNNDGSTESGVGFVLDKLRKRASDCEGLPFPIWNLSIRLIDLCFFHWESSLGIGNITNLLSGRSSNGYILTNSRHYQSGLVSFFC